MNTLHGLTQSVWDLRRLLSWIESQSATSVGLYGVSLGAYVTALLTALDDRITWALAGIPVSNYLELFQGHTPPRLRAIAREHAILEGPAQEVHRVVSPLAMPTRVPKDRLFLFAGLGDRVVRPSQAHALWQHWGKPEILWYHGNHVAYLLSGEVRRFVARVIGERARA
jgi:dipeptidyl aminopeptidase/acylaminoacyl peptidase